MSATTILSKMRAFDEESSGFILIQTELASLLAYIERLEEVREKASAILKIPFVAPDAVMNAVLDLKGALRACGASQAPSSQESPGTLPEVSGAASRVGSE